MQNLDLNKVRTDLELFMGANEVSQKAISRALGVSDTAISQFRKGEYKGKADALAQKIALYLENYQNKGTKTPLKPDELFISNDFKYAKFVIDEAAREKEIAIITGTAGSGKSTIAAAWAKQHPNAILIEATLHTTPKVLLEEIEHALRLPQAKNCHEKILAISKDLKRRDVVLLIDEAEHLSVKALEDLRRIWDFSGVPLILFGTEILMRNLMGKNGELRQLYSRIGGKWQLKGLSKDECAQVTTEGVWNYTQGNFRSSVKLFKRALRLAEMHGTALDGDILASAVSMIIL